MSNIEKRVLGDVFNPTRRERKVQFMCGICGLLWFEESGSIRPANFDAMVNTLAHRGPDDRGTRFFPLENGTSPEKKGIALGHRRLSIIDLSELGRQPLCNEDESIWITFNGEIYNYSELKGDLERKGHQFHTATDTEVIVHLYEEYGLKFVDYLNGMFAVGLWDSRKKRLILARDRMGKKPLYWRAEKNRILFASELKALLKAPNVPKALDPIALDQYLTYQYVPHPRSIYQGIQKLPPGHLAVWSLEKDGEIQKFCDFSSPLPSESMDFLPMLGEFHIRPFWIPDCEEDRDLSFSDSKAELRKRIEHAVQIRMRSDVPLGAFLSGGIDSTIIVGLMQKFSSQKVKTFSIGFPQKEYDETAFARRTAERLGTDHEEFFVSPDARAIFPELVRQYDEPFADSSAIPTWYLSELTRKKVIVALSGDGGDELFLGYDRYKAVRLAGIFTYGPAFFRKMIGLPLSLISLLPAPVHQRSLLRRAKRFFEVLPMEPTERYLQWIAYFNRQRKEKLYTPEFRRRIEQEKNIFGGKYDMCDFLDEYRELSANRDFTTSISITDLLTYLPGALMCKVDIASMRHSLEVRAPFLDRDVVSFALKMPMKYKLRGSKGKYILRETFREFLPPELENRPKTGFGVPLDHWFRGPLRDLLHDLLLSKEMERTEIFDPEYVRSLVREHEEKKFDHSARLWALLVFMFWYQENL
ncbi:MAG: asparagine synthase (glutamine-hydrolyzing) [Planctomycetia bacterium]|nr:asparagine synthase (glutamine-hydrolyzing) [Planctomycetia bacterium]